MTCMVPYYLTSRRRRRTLVEPGLNLLEDDEKRFQNRARRFSVYVLCFRFVVFGRITPHATSDSRLRIDGSRNANTSVSQEHDTERSAEVSGNSNIVVDDQ